MLWSRLCARQRSGTVCQRAGMKCPLGITLSSVQLHTLDPAFAAYVAMAGQDHRYNNPILMVFLAIMQEALHDNRLHGARTPGHASEVRHKDKLRYQYGGRLPNARLIPLVVEVGGRWHPSVREVAHTLARAYVRRTAALSDEALGQVVSRWAARLSAILVRGSAAVLSHAGFAPAAAPRDCVVGAGPLPHIVPEDDSAYELLVR